MGNLGGGEILVLLLLALLLLGPERLPEAARQFAHLIRQIRSHTAGFQEELRATFEDTSLETQARLNGKRLLEETERTSAVDETGREDVANRPRDSLGENGVTQDDR